MYCKTDYFAQWLQSASTRQISKTSLTRFIIVTQESNNFTLVTKQDISIPSLFKHIWSILNSATFSINPFVPNAPILYPLKTSENLTFF